MNSTKALDIAIAIIAASMAFGLTTFATSLYGAGVSPDSVSYFGAVRSILSGDGIPHSFTSWPPLYPVILAGASTALGSADLAQVAAIFGALISALIVLTAAFALRRDAALSVTTPTIALLIIAFSEPLLWISTSAWSDSLFLLLSLWALLLIDSGVRRESVSTILLAAICAALAFLTRYIGFTVIAAGALAILLSPIRTRWRHAVLFVSVASAPPALWLVRNFLVDGTLAGPRAPISGSLISAAHDAIIACLHWLPLPAVAILAVLSMLIRFAGLRSVLAIFAAVYFASVVLLASRIAFDALDKRLLAPATLTLFLFLARQLAPLEQWLRQRKLGAAIALVAVLGLLWIAASETIAEAKQLAVNGAGGVNVRFWHDQPLIAYLREHPPTGPIQSNAPEALIALLGVQAQLSPRREVPLEQLRGSWPAHADTLVAWFWPLGRPYLYDINELSDIAETELVQNFDDATLIRASVRSSP
jgi:hypothetical protein